jgi:hypothetical protein
VVMKLLSRRRETMEQEADAHVILAAPSAAGDATLVTWCEDSSFLANEERIMVVLLKCTVESCRYKGTKVLCAVDAALISFFDAVRSFRVSFRQGFEVVWTKDGQSKKLTRRFWEYTFVYTGWTVVITLYTVGGIVFTMIVINLRARGVSRSRSIEAS